jgi:hypothetical protein
VTDLADFLGRKVGGKGEYMTVLGQNSLKFALFDPLSYIRRFKNSGYFKNILA